MTQRHLQSWLETYAEFKPSILLGACDLPGGERSVFAHSPTHEVHLGPGDVDRLNETLESTRSGCGGWIGYLSYEFGLPFVFEPSLASAITRWPAGFIRYYPQLEWIDSEAIVLPNQRQKPALDLRATISDKVHAQRIESLLERSIAGDIYEANLTRRFVAEPCDPERLFLDLAQHAPAPYAAYLKTDFGHLVCNSPEGFLRLDTEGRVSTFPIKGTRPRDPDSEHDERLRAELSSDLKERAEHLMVVDLLRNDLGRVCEAGSIHCGPLFDLVGYPGVWHMVTEIRGQLLPELTRAQLLAATLPAGSITGAPKRAAVQHIHRLEQEPRGPYCGIILVATDEGDLIANVIIRTALCDNNETIVQTGGGIVLDSDPQRECAETWLKLGNFASGI